MNIIKFRKCLARGSEVSKNCMQNGFKYYLFVELTKNIFQQTQIKLWSIVAIKEKKEKTTVNS